MPGPPSDAYADAGAVSSPLTPPETGRGLRVTLLGIPVSFELSFAVVLGFFGYVSDRSPEAILAWIVLGGISILVHEFGHALTYRAFGVAPRVRLHGFGGVTYGAELSPLRSIAVSAAGPLAGIALGLAILVVARSLAPIPRDVADLVGIALFMNLGWSVFNLLPILPLDGSHIVGGLLERLAGPRAERWTIYLSLVTSAGLAALAVIDGQIFLAVFVLFLALAAWQALRALNERPHAEALTRGWQRLEAGDPAGAIADAQHVLAARAPTEIGFRAAELIVWSELARGDTDAARAAFVHLGGGTVGSELLRRTMGVAAGDTAAGLAGALVGWTMLVPIRAAMRIVADRGLVQQVLAEARARDRDERVGILLLVQAGLHGNGRYADSALVGSELFERDGSALAAYNVACSLARLGRRDEAIGWLTAAVDRADGRLPDPVTDEDLASLRDEPAFQALYERVTAPA